MLILKSLLPFLASLTSILFTLLSLVVPWSCPNVIYDMSDYEVSIPVDMGILSIEATAIESTSASFRRAGFAALPFLLSSTILCAYSVSISTYYLAKYEELFFIGQNLVLISSISFSVLALLIYVFMTIYFLKGGYYTDGVWINSFSIMFGLLCVLVSLSIDSKISHQNRNSKSYTSIDQT
jgi:hypothetical protein